MTDPQDTAAALVPRVLDTVQSGRRRLIALAGPPASGKSTLAEALATQLTRAGCAASVVPMDGFHLDNRILTDRGLLTRKGAPRTFDVRGLIHLVARLKVEDDVLYPTFDRDRDIAIAGSGLLPQTCDTVIIEGNYLLYDAPDWRDLAAHWDLSVRLHVEQDTLRARLVERWLRHGLSATDAAARAEGNDLANAAMMAAARLPADITI